jgi:hypothetical protein
LIQIKDTSAKTGVKGYRERAGNEAMRDYQDACRELSVPRLAREVLHGNLEDGINAAIECRDRWAGGGRVALNWIGKEKTPPGKRSPSRHRGISHPASPICRVPTG